MIRPIARRMAFAKSACDELAEIGVYVERPCGAVTIGGHSQFVGLRGEDVGQVLTYAAPAQDDVRPIRNLGVRRRASAALGTTPELQARLLPADHLPKKVGAYSDAKPDESLGAQCILHVDLEPVHAVD
jgi:hypothetical protein